MSRNRKFRDFGEKSDSNFDVLCREFDQRSSTHEAATWAARDLITGSKLILHYVYACCSGVHSQFEQIATA